MTRIMDTLHEDLRIFVIITGWIYFRIRDIFEKRKLFGSSKYEAYSESKYGFAVKKSSKVS